MQHSALIFDLAETVETIPVDKKGMGELKNWTCRYYLSLKVDWLMYRATFPDDPVCFNEFCRLAFLTSRGLYNPNLN